MKEHTRLLSLGLAVLFSVSCLIFPASANPTPFYYTKAGHVYPLQTMIYDSEGHLSMTRDASIPAGGQLRLGEMDGSALALSAGEQATAHITLASAAPFEIGYTLNDGPYNRLQRNGSASTTHSATLTVTTSGNYRFILKNIGTVGVVLTEAYVDIVGA